MIQWDQGEYPAKLWAFVDLTALDEDEEVEVDDGAVGHGVWAIVESADYVDEGDAPKSDIFRPLMLETNHVDEDGVVGDRKFYIVDVETFKDPIVVIPDIGSKPKCQYLLMSPRSKWSEDFIDWIKSPHKHDVMEMLPDPVPAEEEP